MYLSELKLWNYRKYTDADGSTNENDSHLIMSFTKGLNVIVGKMIWVDCRIASGVL